MVTLASRRPGIRQNAGVTVTPLLPNPTRLGLSTNSSVSVSYAANSLLIVYSQTPVSGDTGGHTWTQRAADPTLSLYIYTAPTTTSGTTTISITGSSNYIVVDQVAAVATFVQATANHAVLSSITITLSSTPIPGNLLVGAVMGFLPGSDLITPPAGWTPLTPNIFVPGGFELGTAYEQNASSGKSSTWSAASTGTAQQWAAVMELS